MNIKQRKILAEWFGYKIVIESEILNKHLNDDDFIKEFNQYDGCLYDQSKYPEIRFISGGKWGEVWQPDIDSNQLDMLEDRMLEECKKRFNCSIQFAISQNSKGIWRCDSYFCGEGETKNEARLNVILNYINYITNTEKYEKT